MKYLIVIISLLCSLDGFTQIKKVKEKKGKYGFVMKQGGRVEYKYDEVEDTYSGLYGVLLGEKWGVVNKDGKLIAECKYDSLVLRRDHCKVKQNGLWGVISKDGEVIMAVNYQIIQEYKEGVAIVKTEKGWGEFDNGSIEYNTDNFVFFLPEELPMFGRCTELEGNYKERKKCTDGQLMKYIEENIVYPNNARLKGIEGSVIISFIVTKKGNLRDLKILKDPGYGCGAEVVRLMESIAGKGSWVAGRADNKPINCKMHLPVLFRLNGRKRKNK